MLHILGIFIFQSSEPYKNNKSMTCYFCHAHSDRVFRSLPLCINCWMHALRSIRMLSDGYSEEQVKHEIYDDSGTLRHPCKRCLRICHPYDRVDFDDEWTMPIRCAKCGQECCRKCTRKDLDANRICSLCKIV